MRRAALIALAAAGLLTPMVGARTPAVAATRPIVVSSTIQAAVDAAAPGDTVVVPAGVYRENVVVTTPGLIIRGEPGAVLDGTAVPGSAGIRVRPASAGQRLAGFTLSGLRISNYSFTGVLLSGVDGFRLTGGDYVDNEEYGIFPIRSTGGRVDGNTVRGSHDSGIYIGQSDDVLIDHNRVSDNTVGIEVELANDITVEHNTATGNAVGVLIQIVPGLPRTETRGVVVKDNVLAGNTRPNSVTDPDELLSRLPGGVGVLNIAGNHVSIAGNVVTGNPTGGVGVVSLPPDLAALDPRLDPTPDQVAVVHNVVHGNGTHPDPRLGAVGAADVVWDGTGTDVCFTTAPGQSSFPGTLPAC